jgi:integrase
VGHFCIITSMSDGSILDYHNQQLVKEGKQPEIKRIVNHSFKDLSVEYLKWAERQRGFEQKENVIKQLTDNFARVPLRSFTSRVLEQYQTERLQKGNKPATINRHIATIKHMFTKAVEWDMLEESALKKIRRIRLLEENNRRLRYLSREECQALINECNNYLKPIVITALNTGMRKGEILNLSWDNIDMRHGFILLDRTKNGERREIPIDTTLRVTLQGLPRRLDVSLVFCDVITGKPRKDFRDSFYKACRRANIRDFHFHDLRHTFASHLVMAGVDITTVKELLGHKTLTMTLRYSHLSPAHAVKALDILNDALTERPILRTPLDKFVRLETFDRAEIN